MVNMFNSAMGLIESRVRNPLTIISPRPISSATHTRPQDGTKKKKKKKKKKAKQTRHWASNWSFLHESYNPSPVPGQIRQHRSSCRSLTAGIRSRHCNGHTPWFMNNRASNSHEAFSLYILLAAACEEGGLREERRSSWVTRSAQTIAAPIGQYGFWEGPALAIHLS